VAQIDGLTDINHLARLILHQVAAGLVGDRTENTLDMIGNFHGKKIVSQGILEHFEIHR